MTAVERRTYTVVEAAQVVGVSRDRMYRLCHAEGFPAIFVSPRRIVIPKCKLHEWLEKEAEKSITG
jgi:excisionase family DNA binding protein